MAPDGNGEEAPSSNELKSALGGRPGSVVLTGHRHGCTVIAAEEPHLQEWLERGH